MRWVKAISVLVAGPLLGLILAFIFAARALPPDPNFEKTGHAAPGDGFLILAYVFVSLIISLPTSAVIAGVMLFRSAKPTRVVQDTLIEQARQEPFR